MTIQKPLGEEEACCKSKLAAIMWMTVFHALLCLRAGGERLLPRVISECNAKSTRLDRQTRSRTFYAAIGATIVKDLDKLIIESRLVSRLLRQKNYH